MKKPASFEAKIEASNLDAERWVEQYGDALFGFVLTRVRGRAAAEDLVQETFLAALKAREAFAGRSTERAWLFGILRNKLVDHYRRQKREVLLGDHDDLLAGESAFLNHGFHRESWDPRLAPKPWETPDESLSNKEFQEVLRDCMSRLPESMADVFRMREIDGVSFDNICTELGVSSSNVSVLLHRARMGLRRCLEVHWFVSRARKPSRKTAPSKGTPPS